MPTGVTGFNVLEHARSAPPQAAKATMNGTTSPGPSPPRSFPPSAHAQPPPTPGATSPPTFNTAEDPIRRACDLLEVGLAGEAYSLLLSASSSSPYAPHPCKAAEVERLAGHAASIKLALREKQFDRALKEWNDAKVLWTKEGGRGGGRQRGVPWDAKVWKFEALEGAKKWGELEKFARCVDRLSCPTCRCVADLALALRRSDTLGAKPQDRQLVLYYKAQALYQVCKLEDAMTAVSDAEDTIAGPTAEKIR